MRMHLTFKQVCDNGKINESTGRFYKGKFEEFFSSDGVGRHKKYDDRATELLILIAKLYSEGNDYEQVRMSLEGEMGVTVTSIVTQQSSSSSEVVQQDIENCMRRVFREEMEKRDAVIFELQEELESVKETLLRIEQKGEESAKTALDRDREVIEAIRTVQTVTQQQSSRTWWQRFRGK
jgi:hypothetical protein